MPVDIIMILKKKLKPNIDTKNSLVKSFPLQIVTQL